MTFTGKKRRYWSLTGLHNVKLPYGAKEGRLVGACSIWVPVHVAVAGCECDGWCHTAIYPQTQVTKVTNVQEDNWKIWRSEITASLWGEMETTEGEAETEKQLHGSSQSY